MPTARLTYRDYLRLPDDGLRYEILDGQVVVSPSAGSNHQGVQAGLVIELGRRIRRPRRGRVFSDLDCELAPHDVVRPDVLVVLTANAVRIIKTRVIGTPDLVIEIFSPGTANRDRTAKRRRYVHDGTAFGRPTEHRGKIRLHVLPDVEIDLREVW